MHAIRGLKKIYIPYVDQAIQEGHRHTRMAKEGRFVVLIQPKFLTFSDLVGKRLFRIPEYQRAYSWWSKHRKDLFEDITKLRGKSDESKHFMATVVGLQRAHQTINTDEYTRLDIVDGQQRLTTLIILCKAISKHLDRSDKAQRILCDEIENLLVKDEEGTLLLLQTNHDKSTYFADYLRKGVVPEPSVATFRADRDLAEAIVECEQFVNQWKGNEPLLTLAALIKNSLTFIFHEIDDEAAVYTVFEVLNSRGLDVAWLDRTKSALMALAFEQSSPKARPDIVKELHLLWSNIYKTLGLHQGLSTETLRFAATLKSPNVVSKVLSEENSLDTLLLLCGQRARTTVEISEWILRVAQAVDLLVSDRRHAAVTQIAHARLLATAINLSKFDQKIKDTLLNQWERTTFRIFGMAAKDARTKVGEYVRLAQAIVSGQPSPIFAKKALDELRDLAQGEYAIEDVVEELRMTNCYDGWEEELRYFLFRYEEHLAKNANQKFSNEQWDRIWRVSPSKSIEHIYPRNPERGNAWRSLGPAGQERHVNRLGNLALLPPGLNTKLGNKSFEIKKAGYRKTGLFLLEEIVRKKTWNRAAIDEREEGLLNWAREAWADL